MSVVTSARHYGLRVGIFFAIAGAASQSLTAGIAKFLIQDYHVVQLLWIRNLFLILTLFMLSGMTSWEMSFRTSRPLFQLGRALLPLFASLFILFSLQHLPLAEATAILFVSPLFLTALSIPLLKERVGASHWGAIAIGFLGVGVILRPGTGVVDWAALLLLSAAALIALYQISTKILSASADLSSTLFYTGLVGLVATTIPLPFFWSTPDFEGLLLILGLGATYGGSQFFWFRALSAAPASTLAPFVYTQIVVATAFGFFVFGEIPDFHSLLGTAIIIGSGLYIFLKSGTSVDRQITGS